MKTGSNFSFLNAKPPVIFFSLLVLNFILLIPSFLIPFFGDDFSWLLQVKNSDGSFVNFLASPAPFGYFRPLSKLFFYATANLFGYSALPFRIVVIVLHTLCSFLIYKFSISVKYESKTAVLSALIFSVLACHAETLFFVNCVNEIFSAIFILTGLCLFSEKRSFINSTAIIFCFLVALLSRESAVCYLPLLFLVNHRIKSRKPAVIMIISIMPMMLYTLLRLLSETYFGNSNVTSLAGSIDTNPVKFIYKIFHYFINMLLPGKTFFEITGFEFMESLIQAFRNPSENLFLFSFLIIAVLVAVCSVIVCFWKVLKSELWFPILFILASLLLYLLSKNTAERFLYLPSAGMSILLALFFTKLKHKKAGAIALTVFVLMHAGSLFYRTFRYINAAKFSQECMHDLYIKTAELTPGSKILLENLPPKKSGIFFLSIPNIQPNWDYNYPDKKIYLTFEEIKTSGDKIDAVYRFDNEDSEFERTK